MKPHHQGAARGIQMVWVVEDYFLYQFPVFEIHYVAQVCSVAMKIE